MSLLLVVGLTTGLLAVGSRYPGGVGEQTYQPIEWAAVPPRYERNPHPQAATIPK